jgi:uncharacterized protein YjbI with pentapeptide repeats
MLKKHPINNSVLYCTQGELRNCDLKGANLERADLERADLKMAKGV